MHPTTPSRWGMRALALCAAVVMLTAGALLVGQRAWALWVDVPPTGQPGYLSLASDPYPAHFPDLSPGDVAHWQIRVDLNDADADVTMQMAREGALVNTQGGLLVSATACSQEWDLTAAPACHGTQTQLFGPTDAADASLGPMVSAGATFPASSPVWDVGWMSANSTAFVLVTLTVPDTEQSRSDTGLMGLESSIDFAFTAFGGEGPPPGEEPPVREPSEPGEPTDPSPEAPSPPGMAGPPELSVTGTDVSALALIAAGMLLLVGFVLRGSQRAARDGGQP